MHRDSGARFAKVVVLVEEALAGGLGSAAAVSIGEGGVERARAVRGHRWRVPALGPALEEGCEFDLASLTKPMVSATLAMIFVERGLLSLDEPVRRWLPDAATAGSVAELLAHTAGCAAHVKFYEQLPGGCRAGESARQALLRLARTEPLTGVAGKDTVYSDLGYLMLGELLEQVGGRALDELYAREIAGPLGLGCRYRRVGGDGGSSDSGGGGNGADGLKSGGGEAAGCVATELDERGGALCGAVHDENARAGGGVFGHAGLFGTIGDVGRFAAAMLAMVGGGSEGRLVSAETARRFFTMAPGRASWRLGWDTPSPKPGISHAGDLWPRVSGVGHLGFTGTSLWLDLARGRWVALLTNRVHPSRNGSAEGIKQLRRAVMDAAWLALESGG